MRGLCKPTTVGQSGALLGELLDFTVLQLQGGQLVNLILQQLELRIAVARFALELEGAVQQLEPHPIGDSYLSGEWLELAVTVEQLALRRAAHERLEFVLTVDIDEDVAGLTQQLQGHGLPVEVCA